MYVYVYVYGGGVVPKGMMVSRDIFWHVAHGGVMSLEERGCRKCFISCRIQVNVMHGVAVMSLEESGYRQSSISVIYRYTFCVERALKKTDRPCHPRHTRGHTFTNNSNVVQQYCC